MRIGDFSIVGQSEAIIGRASPYQGLSPDHNHLWGLVSPTPRSNHHKNLWDQSYNHFKNRSFNERFYPDAFHFFFFPTGVKIFYFKYFYRDEIILILFSPLSKLTPHSIQDDFQHVLTRRLTEFTGLLESWINYFRIWSRSEAEGMKILERQNGPNWKK